MALRSRMVNPDLFKDEDLAAMHPCALQLFVGLWCMAEDSGCLEDRPRVIRAELFGLRDDVTVADVEGWLSGLVDCGKLRRYEVDSRHYLHITRFLRHQRFKYLPKGACPLPPGLAEELAAVYGKPGGQATEPSASLPASSLDVLAGDGDFHDVPEHSGEIGNVGGQEKRREEKVSKAEQAGIAAAPLADASLLGVSALSEAAPNPTNGAASTQATVSVTAPAKSAARSSHDGASLSAAWSRVWLAHFTDAPDGSVLTALLKWQAELGPDPPPAVGAALAEVADKRRRHEPVGSIVALARSIYPTIPKPREPDAIPLHAAVVELRERRTAAQNGQHPPATRPPPPRRQPPPARPP